MSNHFDNTNMDFQQILSSLENFCEMKYSWYCTNMCMNFICPLLEREKEHVMLEEELNESVDESLCWYVVNFYACEEIVILKSTSDKAENIADNYGQPYELYVYDSLEAAYEMLIKLNGK